jgi:hypothetical protein
MKFIYHSDAGHGWLEVPAQVAKQLGVKPSAYSYVSGDRKTWYLEEDLDAPKFLAAMRETDIEWNVDEVYDGNDSFIRNMQKFDGTYYPMKDPVSRRILAGVSNATDVDPYRAESPAHGYTEVS